MTPCCCSRGISQMICTLHCKVQFDLTIFQLCNSLNFESSCRRCILRKMTGKHHKGIFNQQLMKISMLKLTYSPNLLELPPHLLFFSVLPTSLSFKTAGNFQGTFLNVGHEREVIRENLDFYWIDFTSPILHRSD